MTVPGDFALQVESAPAEYRRGLYRIFRGQWLGYRLHFFAIQCIVAGSIVIVLSVVPMIANPKPGAMAPGKNFNLGQIISTVGVIFAVASKMRLLTDYNHAISPANLRHAFLLHVVSQVIRLFAGGGFWALVSMVLYTAGTLAFLLYLRDVAVHLRRVALEGMAYAAIITFILLVFFSASTVMFTLALMRQLPIGILSGPSMMAAALMGVAFWLCYSRIVWALGSSYADLARRIRPVEASGPSATPSAHADDVFEPF